MINIERANINEAEAIRQLLSETWLDTYAPYLSQTTLNEVTSIWHSVELLKSQITNPAIFFDVAKDEADTLVGLVTLQNMGNDGLVIYRLYVRPDYQRMGIGQKLLNEALAAFPHHNKVRLDVIEQNRKGLAFWRKHGFREIGRKDETIVHEIMRVIEMQRP